MKNKVSEVVKKTLNEKYEIDSKFNLILENESLSDKQKFNQALDFICELEESGKSREEIDEQFLGGIGDWFSKYLKPGADDTSSKTGLSTDPDNNVQKFGSAAASQLRTYLITQGLGLMGFKGR